MTKPIVVKYLGKKFKTNPKKELHIWQIIEGGVEKNTLMTNDLSITVSRKDNDEVVVLEVPKS